MKKLSEKEKAELKAKMESARRERVQRISEVSKEQTSLLRVLLRALGGWF